MADLDALDDALVRDGLLPKLAGQCAALERQIAERNRAAAPSQAATPFGRRDFQLFHSTTIVLHQLRAGLEPLIRGAVELRDGCLASGKRRDLIDRINEATEAGASGPAVRWLLELSSALERAGAVPARALLTDLAGPIGAEPADLGPAPRPLRARLALLARLVDRLDVLGVGAETWETVQRTIPRLIPPAEAAVRLLRGYQVDLSLVEIAPAEDDAPARLIRSGLSLRTPGAAASVPLRRVAFSVPDGGPLEAGALLELASWLDATSQPAGDLSALCREQAAALRSFATAGDWWAQADERQRSPLWRVLQRAAGWLQRPGREGAAAVLQALTAFEAAGFRLAASGVVPANGPVRFQGPWFLAPTTAGPGAGDGHTFGPMLATPDGLFGPTVWLRLPPAAPGGSRLARCLTHSEPLLAFLKLTDDKPPTIDGAPSLVEEWFNACQQAVWQAAVPSVKDAAGIRERFCAALGQRAGRDWLHRFVELAVQPDESSKTLRAREWLEALIAHPSWCRVYPEPRRDAQGTWRFHWTDDAASDPSHPPRKFDASVPYGEVIGRVERFAAEPSEARCTVSLGREDQGTPWAAAWRAREEAQKLGPGFAAIGDRLWKETLCARSEGMSPAVAEALAREVLAALVKMADAALAKGEQMHSRLGAADAARLDRLLGALRAWCLAADLEVLPRGWTFAGRMHRDGLAADEQTIRPAIRALEDPRGEVVHVVEFGLARRASATLIVPCQLRVSSGKAPEHFIAMLEAARDSHSEAGKALTQKLREWPEAWMLERLAPVAEAFFVDFWDKSYTRFRAEDPVAAKRFVDEFEQLLQKSCGLRADYPDSILGQKPNSYEVRSRTGTVTGRVVEVLRPGLHSRSGVRVPAIVVVE
jgi:hypothetical protein